ncbi:hypothetical protein ON010_g17985 [Phytophthora cinnamomi]|nr:hypothetical protein ON010_g17985 [Phytophthora cinnamomi]
MATAVYAARLHDHAIRYSGCSATPTPKHVATAAALQHVAMAAASQHAIMAAATTQAAMSYQQHQCGRERPTPPTTATYFRPSAHDRQACTPWCRAGQRRRHTLVEPPTHAQRQLLVDHADTGVAHAVILRPISCARSRSNELGAAARAAGADHSPAASAVVAADPGLAILALHADLLGPRP